MKSIIKVVILLCLASSCGPDFAEQSEIDRPQVLAIHAAQSQLLFGESILLTPLMAGFSAEDATFNWSWCLLRGDNTQEFRCLSDDFIDGFIDDFVDSSTITIEDLPQIAEQLFSLGNSETATLTAVIPPEQLEQLCDFILSVDEFPLFATRPECKGSLAVSVRFDVFLPSRTITTFKTVELVYDEDEYEPNRVHSIRDLGLRLIPTTTTATVTVYQSVKRNDPIERNQNYLVVLGEQDEVVVTPEGLRRFLSNQLDDLSDQFLTEDDENDRETLTLFWFTTAGTMDSNITGFLPDTLSNPFRTREQQAANEPYDDDVLNEWQSARLNTWSTPLFESFPDSEATLFLVIRDGRGGTDWTSRTINFRAPGL